MMALTIISIVYNNNYNKHYHGNKNFNSHKI